MAHHVTERDNLFTTRTPAWHGLGTVFPDHPTREEAQKIAHNWEPITAPIFSERPIVGEDGDLTTVMEEVEGFKSVVRSDTSDVLGVVSESYTPVNNSEMYDIAEAIEGEAKGSVMYETGGSLKGGSKVWLLIRLRDPLIIGGDDATATIPYYALQNNHDGLGSFRGQATMTRIVCDNTAQVADLDARARGTEFVFRHTRNVKDRIEEARAALAGWRESVETYRLLAEHLASEPISRSEARLFIDSFIPEPMEHIVTERVRNNIDRSREAWWQFYNDQTTERLQNTRWGLVQASVEYLNHGKRAHTQESRFKRSYLDRSELTQQAMKIAQAV